ncbi:MAG: dephospho-CoA kinase [Candidatus Arcticimaribacter sp.]|nr:MAG: dephospho-CoA kinase [Candidatus Arcticimaribacter sp.]
MPRIIGLTGGIGSGKSKVALRFSALGIPCYIADDRAKDLMNTSADLKEAICKLFGSESYSGGVLNRPYIANVVFKDATALAQLNALVHPAVAQDFIEWVAKQEAPYVIKEAAILFENGGSKLCDSIILITAPEAVRLKRVLARDNSSVQEIEDRMSKQWSDERKIPLADYHIENMEWNDTILKIDAIHQELIQISLSKGN